MISLEYLNQMCILERKEGRERNNRPSDLIFSERNFISISKNSFPVQLQVKCPMGNKSSKKRYKIPPNAAKPDPPGTPRAETQENGVYLQWACPKSDGKCPIIGYIVQHSELEDGSWYSSNPIPGQECLIHNLENGATYQFRVIAENLIGYSSPSKSSEPILFSKAFALPRFLTHLQNITAIENEKVEFQVHVTGRPQPELKWYLNGEEILSNQNLIIDGPRLTIKRATSELQGEITCSAINQVGVESSRAQLTVGVPPRILDEASRETIFRVGELLRIKFTYSGKPKPDVYWFHDGNPLDWDSSNIEVLANSSSMKVDNATRADRGEYTIRVENNLGMDTGSLLVTVADKPNPPSAPSISLLRDNSVVLEWEEGSDDGGCPVQCFIVEYFRTEWDVWLTGATSRSRVAKIRDLIPGSYKFRIKAENLYGLSEASKESLELLIPELSSGLMSPLPETEEENYEKRPEEVKMESPQFLPKDSPATSQAPPSFNNRLKQLPGLDKNEDRPNVPLIPKQIPPIKRDSLILDHYGTTNQRSPSPRGPILGPTHRTLDQRSKPWNQYQRGQQDPFIPVSDDSRPTQPKSFSLPREANNARMKILPRGESSLSPSRSSSVASSMSHLILEGSFSDDEEADKSIVTTSSLTVLKSGDCQIKTSSREELTHSYESISKRTSTSKNSLNSEDIEYYNSIFGKSYFNQEDDGEGHLIQRSRGGASQTADQSESSVTETPEANSWSWWWYFLIVPISLCIFLKFTFYSNVCILLYVFYRLVMLFFE